MQKFTLNGRFLVQSVTGVQRVAREALMVFDQMAAAGDISVPRLLLPAHGEIVALPDLQAITPERVGNLRGHAWEQIELPAHCGAEPLLCLGNTAPVLRLWCRGRPVVTMVHDLSYKYFPDAYSWKFRSIYGVIMPVVLRQSDHVVTVSDAERQSIMRHYPFLKDSSRLSYLQNGGIPDKAARTVTQDILPSCTERDYGIYVGSLTRRKNASGLLLAAIRFLRRYSDMRFVVIGATGASFEGVSVKIPDDVVTRLEFWGQVNEAQEIYDALRGARFLLFPSFYEASPLPPVEAMTFGCPVVSSKIPSLVERCGEAASYCDPTDGDSIDAAINRLMEDPLLWDEMSEAGLARAARYTWQAQALGLLHQCEGAE